MKIRHKLTLSFSITVTLILAIFGITIYYFSSTYRKNEFFSRLMDRVEITEKMFLEKENLSNRTYELIREQFLNKLPAETEEALDIHNGKITTSYSRYPSSFINELLKNEKAYFQTDSLQGVGQVFHLKGGDFAVILTARDETGIRMLAYLRIILILTLAGCILFVGLVGYYISGKVLNPISKKIQKANAISVKNLHERLTVYNPDDEIGGLAIAFNNLLDRVAGAFDAQRSFIDNASHEMRNPLTAIIGEAEVALEKKRSQEEYIESIKLIATEADRLNSLVNNLLHLATISYREVAIKTERIDIRQLLQEAKRKFDFSCPANHVQLRFNGYPSSAKYLFVIEGNSHLLETAFINIFDNASKFSFFKEVDVSLNTQSVGKVSVSIRDQGVGIPPGDLSKVTIPFHRAANVRRIKGTGIGIPLALKIVELHKGTLEIISNINKGTEVIITLPILN